MDLTSILQLIWQTALFSMGVYALTFVVRALVEKAAPKLRVGDNYYWRELVLPILPTLLGTLVGALVVVYPYPEAIESTFARAMYGGVCGLFSGLSYRVLKSAIQAKLAGKDQES